MDLTALVDNDESVSLFSELFVSIGRLEFI